MQGRTQTHTQLRNWHHCMPTRSSGLSCVSGAEHHSPEQYSKTGSTKPRKHLSRNNISWNTWQDFFKIPLPLRRCSRNRAKMRFKSRFGIKCHYQYNKVKQTNNNDLLEKDGSIQRLLARSRQCIWLLSYPFTIISYTNNFRFIYQLFYLN